VPLPPFSPLPQASNSNNGGILRLSELSPKNPAYLSNRAAAYMSQRRYRLALNDVTSAAALQSDAPQSKTLARLGRCQLAVGEAVAAIDSLRQALSFDPTNAVVRSDLTKAQRVEQLLGRVARDREREEWSMVIVGVEHLEREIDEPPSSWKRWRVEALLGKRRVDEASSLALDLLRSSPKDPEALLLRGRVLYYQGSNTQAINHVQEALRCDPDFKAARTLLRLIKSLEAKKEEGNAAFKAGRAEEAISLYGEAMAIDEANESMRVTLLSNRAVAYQKVGCGIHFEQ
jgi:DnaJ homolog subfamily C member 7